MSKPDEKTTKAAGQENKSGAVVPMPKAQEPPKVDEVKKMLDVQIHKWEQLSMKIEHRERFLRTIDRIKEFSAKIKQERDKNNPDQESFFLKLSSTESYNNRAEISINNVEIISEFLTFINAKIETKILQLEKEIIM
jgi:cytochrome P450